MKKIFCLLVVLIVAYLSKAQLIKDIGRGIKRDAEYRVEQKAREAVRKGIDSLEKKTKKKKEKNEDAEKQNENNSNKGTVTEATQETKEESPEAGEGFITLKLSTPITSKGLTVTISGESIKYQKWNSVKLLIKAPNEEEQVKLALSDSGRYSLIYDKLLEEGDYVITAVSSDGKAEVTERLLVIDYFDLRDETKDLMDATGKAFERLKNRASGLKGMISKSEATELDRKMDEIKEAVDGINDLATHLQKGKQEVANVIKQGHPLPVNIAHYLTQLNKLITDKTEEIKNVSSAADHQPYENTVCEYIVMMNEAAAAFYTFTAGWMDLVVGTTFSIAKNRAMEWLDPAIHAPEAEAGDSYIKQVSKSDLKWGEKEAFKVFSIYGITTKKAQQLTNKWKQAQFGSNLVRFGADVLLRRYCGVFKGDVSHTYEINYRNSEGQPWWKYAFRLEAVLFLRYPKTTTSGIIKMKGTIEGHATKFSFMADPKNNPEFRQGTGGKVDVMILKSMTPFALPVSASIATENWGWIARATATPAYINIPVDAEYNTETQKVTLFLKEARLDFSEFVYNRQVFILWSAGLPLLRLMDYPISKARLTMNAALKNQNEFDMKKNAKEELFFVHKANRHIGTKTDLVEHTLDISISAKKE